MPLVMRSSSTTSPAVAVSLLPSFSGCDVGRTLDGLYRRDDTLRLIDCHDPARKKGLHQRAVEVTVRHLCFVLWLVIVAVVGGRSETGWLGTVVGTRRVGRESY